MAQARVPKDRQAAQSKPEIAIEENAWLIIDDTALPKKGAHSVGVAVVLHT